MSDPFRRQVIQSSVAGAGIAGGIFAGLAFLIVFVLVQTTPLRHFTFYPSLFPYFVALASLLVSAVCWYFIVEWPRRLTLVRGAIVGLVTGTLVHPLTWTLIFLYQAMEYESSPLAPGFAMTVLLYSIFSLGFTGVVTVIAGALVGIGMAMVRKRTVPWEDTEHHSLGVVVGSSLLTGVVTVVLIVVTAVIIPGLLVGVLLAGLLTPLLLQRLPLVREFLLALYSKSDEDLTPAFADRTFLVRHILWLIVAGVVTLLLFFGYRLLMGYLYYTVLPNLPPIFSQSVYDQIYGLSDYFFPILFVGGGVLLALGATSRWGQPVGNGSRRRLALEWTVFLSTVAVLYTGGFLVGVGLLLS